MMRRNDEAPEFISSQMGQWPERGVARIRTQGTDRNVEGPDGKILARGTRGASERREGHDAFGSFTVSEMIRE